MKLTKVVELTGKHAICPQCKSDKIGNGAGTLLVTADTFKRTCKCGYNIEVRCPNESN